jgi:hypothetical protein
LVLPVDDGEKIVLLRVWRGCEGSRWWRRPHWQLLSAERHARLLHPALPPSSALAAFSENGGNDHHQQLDPAPRAQFLRSPGSNTQPHLRSFARTPSARLHARPDIQLQPTIILPQGVSKLFDQEFHHPNQISTFKVAQKTLDFEAGPRPCVVLNDVQQVATPVTSKERY